MNTDITTISAVEAAKRIKDGKTTSTQLVSTVLKQIERYNKDINAVVTIDKKEAIIKAKQADEMIQTGADTKSLHGIPVTVKDFFKTKGIRSTASTEKFKHNVPKEDATVVKRLKDAGAIILGKTNMPELAMDCQTDSPIFGRTNNPWDIRCTSGGSSGGGAAAVASGMSYLDIGNDLLGSVRIPSSFCGIYSFVPTEKLIPNTGLLVGKPNYGILGRMMRTGIIARSIEDLKMVMGIIAGPDENEADCIPKQFLYDSPLTLDKLKIAWTNDAGGLHVSESVNTALMNFITALEENVDSINRLGKDEFDFNSSREVFLRIFYPVLASNMPPVIRLIARYIGKAKYFDVSLKKYLEAENTRIKLIAQLDLPFQHNDILLCPVTATPAFEHMKPDRYSGGAPIYEKGIFADGQEVNYAEANMGFTIPFSVTGNPIVTLPIGYSEEDLPIGIQVIGRRYNDYKLLDIASMLAKFLGTLKLPFSTEN